MSAGRGWGSGKERDWQGTKWPQLSILIQSTLPAALLLATAID